MRFIDPIPLLLEQIHAEPDPARKLGLQARLVRQQMERSYDVIAADREGSRVDPDVATEHRQVLDSRAKIFDEIARSLEPSLAPSVDVRTATDLLWALANEELYRELVVERGWSADRFEAWLETPCVSSCLRSDDGPFLLVAEEESVGTTTFDMTQGATNGNGPHEVFLRGAWSTDDSPHRSVRHKTRRNTARR